MDSRAAVFTSSPQAVEVYQAGTWWSGELLGWRHDASGACQMWVRVVAGGVEETAWIDLAGLRLPESAAGSAPSRIDSRVKQELPAAQAVSALRGRLATDVATTAALPAVRAEAPVPASPPVTVPEPRRGGRRRAPEVAEASAAADVPAAIGRHRASRVAGRHRATDTGVFAAVPDATDRFAAVPGDAPETVAASAVLEPRRVSGPHTGAGWAVPAARTARAEESIGRSEVCTGRIDVGPDLLTRPMRLSDLAPNARRPRVGGSLSNA